MSDLFERAKRTVTKAFIEQNFYHPSARWENGEYITLSPLRPDSRIGSFSIREDGTFYDFANPNDTGDIITLLARKNGSTMAQAAREILGEADPSTAPSPGQEGGQLIQEAELELAWSPIPEGRVPQFKSAPEYLTLFHIDEQPAFYVARFKSGGKDGGKLIYPIYWTGSQFLARLPKSLKTRPLAMCDRSKTVVIVEGEKCMEEARKAFPQYSWTTWHGGSGAAKKVPVGELEGCDVIVWPDLDEPGAIAAEVLCEKIKPIAKSLRRVDLDTVKGKPKGWDVADAIAEGFNVETLLEDSIIIDEPEEAIDEATIVEPKATTNRPFTDLGNSERFIDMWGHILRYNIDKNKWMVWHGGRWRDNDQSIVTPLVKRTIRTMAEADTRVEAVFWSRKSESSKAVSAMLNLAQRERGIPVSETWLDANPWYMNCPNGVVDLRTGALLEPDPNWLMTKVTNTNYNPSASCPKFLKFLDETFMEDPGILNFIQRWIGYSLTGDVGAQTFAVFYGVGANGKSTLVETIQKIAGDYVKTAPPDTFIQKQAGSIPNDIAALRGSRMVLTTETEANAKLAEARVKSMTGGDRVSARYMRGEYFEFTPTWKITISTNHRPRISGGDYGIWRRIVLVPFNNVVVPERQNPRLQEELLEESEGILRWAVQGAVLWHEAHGGRLGLQVPEAVYAETQEYREDEDVLGRFIGTGCMTRQQIDDAIRMGRITDDRLMAAQVYASFKYWAGQQGEKYLAETTQTAFGRMMRERGYVPIRTAHGREYTGIIPYDIRNA